MIIIILIPLDYLFDPVINIRAVLDVTCGAENGEEIGGLSNLPFFNIIMVYVHSL